MAVSVLWNRHGLIFRSKSSSISAVERLKHFRQIWGTHPENKVNTRWKGNSLSSLGDQKPHPNCKGETNASIEPARLQVPVPFIRVNHMWRKLTHDYSCNCCRCGSKPCSIGPQSLRGYFSNITPAGCAVRC